MKPEILVVIAGMPNEIRKDLVVELSKKIDRIRILTCYPLDRTGSYSQRYSEEIYRRFAENLKKRDIADNSDMLTRMNIVLLYLNKGDDTEKYLLEKFNIETLSLALIGTDIVNTKLDTANQRKRVINELSGKSKRAIDGARILLSVIAEEVTNRDNRTCLLLPPKNYGSKIDYVFSCIRNATANRMEEQEFRRCIKQTTNSLPKKRKRNREYFAGNRDLVFQSPGKSGPRHGRVPDWEDRDHDYSCIVRGRFRFGVAYDPKFHYDCTLHKDSGRTFSSCHDKKTLPKNRAHVNIAPNDNIR